MTMEIDIQVHPTNFNASQDLIAHMIELLNPLVKYNDQIQSMDIYMESISDEKADKQVKVKILTPGHEFFIRENQGDFVSAAQVAFDKLKVLLADQKGIDKERFEKRPDKVY